MKIDIEYPCGLKIKMSSTFFSIFDTISFDYREGCPIHKNDCYGSVLDMKIGQDMKKLVEEIKK